VAAWRVGHAWGVQFHPEVTPTQLASWVSDHLLDELLSRAGIDTEALLAEAERRGRFTVPQGRALVGRFLDGPVRERLAG
jgi:GMP synthase (glutamine-hydrolysing)